MDAAIAKAKPSLTHLIIATSVGNALEWYDIVIYGYFALAISNVFFPSGDPTTGLMLALGTFAISYLARPLGAIVLGGYADRVGRKRSMLISILLMVLATAAIVAMPGYAAIGVAAPVGVLVARLVQGFSAGGEFGSSTAFLVEHAPERRGFLASWQFASQGLSAVLASLMGVTISVWMPTSTLVAWGWRLPFAVGLLVGPVGLWILYSLHEPPRQPAERVHSPLAVVLGSQKMRVLVAIGALIVSTSVNYMLVYMPTYAVTQLGLTSTVGFISTLSGSILLSVVTPCSGAFSDRVSRTKLMLVAACVMLVSFYPCFALLVAHPAAVTLIGVVLWLAFVKSIYYGALPALMAELFPTGTRATGMALAYNIGVPLFGGFGPFVMVWLTSVTGSKLAPSYYLMAVSLLSIAALIAARRHYRLP
jgi:MHS family proline/betaine transporter-like MFS transporter